MLDCLILGDSIAVGTHIARPECAYYAEVGINSKQFNRKYEGEFYSGIVIISLGSNDYKGINTKQELLNLRNRIVAKNKVYWIMPAINPEIQEIVEDIADANNDWIIKIPELSKDGIHPTGKGYQKIGNITK